jgi:heterodisulfide reductase subunit B
MNQPFLEVSYFPGCSLATSAKESNQSLVQACEIIGLRLTELEDWNCCGSSSAHCLDNDLALNLAARNLSLVPAGRPLLIMCPACFKNLLSARVHLKSHPEKRRAQERRWGAAIDADLEIINFLEILHLLGRLRPMGVVPELTLAHSLAGLKAAVYYGCMNMFPPDLRRAGPSTDLMRGQLEQLGAEVVTWPSQNRCCGTFLAATNPEVVGPLVNKIMDEAIQSGAQCLVTACAMCQLNLEIRCTLKKQIPTLHFSEVMALVLGAKDYQGWFNRHLVDPRPLLREMSLIN